jgi:hypothetical protein
VETFTKDGKRYKPFDTDFEAVVPLPDGNFLISSEGGLDQRPPIYPSLTVYTKEGKWVRELTIPDAIHGDEKRTYGARYNRAIESLTFTPDGKYLFFSNEYALLQDGVKPNKTEGGYSRVYKTSFGKDGDLAVEAAYAYHIEPVPVVEGRKGRKKGDNGLTEMIMLNDTDFLAMERSTFEDTLDNVVRVYWASTKGATDIKDVKSLKDEIPKGKIVPITKKLVLEVEPFMQQIPERARKFDKMEGMTLGPKLASGGRLLILSSDNDFDLELSTLFLLFDYKTP